MSNEERARPGIYQMPPVVVEMADDDELTELVPPGVVAELPASLSPEARGTLREVVEEPEFDAYMALSRLVVGGAVEGTAQLIERLEKIERELKREQTAGPKVGEINSTADVLRYAAVGFALSASDGVRRRVIRMLDASDLFWEMTGNTVKPLTDRRLTSWLTAPFERAFDSVVARGQDTVNEWVERGRREEPLSREMALQTYETIVEEFISRLSENPELAELVQQQSVGLVGEVVDEVRSRTVSADVLAETLVRRLLRRPQRTELPAPPEEMQDLVAPKKTYPASRD